MEADDFYQKHGDYGRSRQLLENTLAALRAVDRGHAKDAINPMARLAKLEARLGNFGRSSALYDEVASSVAGVFGEDSIEAARVRIGQATMLFFAHDYPAAVAKGRAAVAIAEKAAGPVHIDVANAQAILGMALAETSQYEESEALERRSIEIARQLKMSEDYLLSVQANLAYADLRGGQIDEAAQILERSTDVIVAKYGANSLNAIELYRALLVLAITRGDAPAAQSVADRMFAAQLHLVRDAFLTMDEEGRLRTKSQIEAFQWYASLGDANGLARAVLQLKAITLDALAMSRSAPAVDPYARLLEPQNAAQTMEPSAPAAHAVAPEATSDSAPIVLFAPTPLEVCRALLSGVAVVEFVRYQHQLGRYREEPRYGALLFRRGNSDADSLQWIPLGDAGPIDRQVSDLLSVMSQPIESARVPALLRALHDAVWRPIEAKLGARGRDVFVCPDGPLCFLPFSALVDADGAFVAEKHTLMFLSTTRDLFRPPPSTTDGAGAFTVFAAPEFGAKAGTASESVGTFRDVDTRGLATLNLPALPGARTEAKVLAGIARENRCTPEIFVGESATEEAVRAMHPPLVVHFATHGFILPEVGAGMPTNPMDGSGLALAGANETLRKLARGETAIDRDHDGLLTAREVMDLPLHGTWLATLAACDTGRGQALAGENVLGLRRGFLGAGAQNLLLALWQVPDRDTTTFMADFYARAMPSRDAARAFADTQRDWLVRLRRERGTPAAAIFAGAFILNTSARFPRPNEQPQMEGDQSQTQTARGRAASRPQ